MPRKDRDIANDRTADDRRAPGLTELKAPQERSSDEAGDPSMQNAEHPMRVREEVANTSDSSGLHSTDEAKGQLIKEQLKQGLREIQPLD